MVSTTATRTLVDTVINDNTSGDITPADVRSAFTETLDHIDALSGPLSSQAASYTTVSSDDGKWFDINNASGVTFTVLTTAAAGTTYIVRQTGVGAVTIAAAGGVQAREGHNKTAGQYAVVAIRVISNSGTSPVVSLFGDTAA